VEIGEEIGDGEVAGMAKSVDEEASVGDEIGVRDGGRRKWWEWERGFREVEGLKSGGE
jgi:hypothetical protein